MHQPLFVIRLLLLCTAGLSCVTHGYSKPKILIVTMKQSGAHMSAAKAIISVLKKEYDCTMLVMDDNSEKFVYETIMRYPVLRVLYNIFIIPVWKVCAALPNLCFPSIHPRLTKDQSINQYVLVISVVPFVNELVYKILNQYASHAKFVIIPTDLSDPFERSGVSGGWLHPRFTEAVYLLAGEKFIEQAKARRLPNIKALSGIIIDKKFTTLTKSKAQLRDELGIPQDKKVVLCLFGSCGTKEMVYLMQLLKDSEYYCIFICGKGAKIQRQLEELNVNNRHRVLGFVSNVEEWMKASDVCIGKPGVIVTAECIASKIPIVIKNGPDVMLQEKYNIEYIRKHKLGIVLEQWKSLPEKLSELFTEYPKYQEALEAFPENHAVEEICNIIESLSIREPVDITELILGY